MPAAFISERFKKMLSVSILPSVFAQSQKGIFSEVEISEVFEIEKEKFVWSLHAKTSEKMTNTNSRTRSTEIDFIFLNSKNETGKRENDNFQSPFPFNITIMHLPIISKSSINEPKDDEWIYWCAYSYSEMGFPISEVSLIM